MDTDIQVGGTDQTFNMQAGRELQKKLRNKESFVLANPFLEGTDGRKMSKTWGNAIWLDEEPNQMYAKAMAINDDLIIEYFTLATNASLEEINKIESELKAGVNPINLKKKLAHLIVTELHDEKSANKAQLAFEQRVQNKELPDDIELCVFEKPELSILEILIEGKLVLSNSEAKRLIEQGGVSIDNEIINNPTAIIKLETEHLLRIGKNKFLRIINR